MSQNADISVGEAEARLPRAGALFAELLQIKEFILENCARLEKTVCGIRRKGGFPDQPPIDQIKRLSEEQLRLIDSFKETYKRLESLGAFPDVQAGLMDFCWQSRDGQVLLCCGPQDQSIKYWHAPDAGHAARRPIEEL